ncbi:serine/threonine-protein phosphatase 7 long form [Dorcoceras hygrometricum]|uniref:Serine/threonine-protein phosphatase 7 long form n=1 Tax=Dorcoceras hygrometricum TaxID=472368 RepID=A0A2Z7D2B2_9LAMI|nr:serine/threonine-protein phosphatase 7 long form [Dorcoceras hygrometricum]
MLNGVGACCRCTSGFWVWSRINVLCPNREQQCSTASEHAADALQGIPIPPYGATWKRVFSWTHTAQQYGDVHVFSSFSQPVHFDLQPPSSARFQDEDGPSASHFHTTTQSEGAPKPTSDSLFYTPQERPFFQSFDHGLSTSFGGSFTKLLQSEYRGLIDHMRPPLNTSPIPYPEHYQSPVHDMITGDSGPITHDANRNDELLEVIGNQGACTAL